MRKPLTIALIALLVLAVAGGVVYTLRAKEKPALAEPPRAEGTPGDEKTGGNEQAAAPKQCLDVEPKPVRYKFNDPNFPTGKLGEWYEVKNEKGQTILRVKVDIEDAVALAGLHKDVDVRALFRLTLENLTCSPFEWDVMGTQGIWYGYRPKSKHRDSELDGWYTEPTPTDTTWGIFLSRNGKIVYPPEDRASVPDFEKGERIFMERYKLKIPEEFPEKAFPPERSTGEFYIGLHDVNGATKTIYPDNPHLGPTGDGHIPLVLGGYMGFAKIDLGTGKDWARQFVGDPDDPKMQDPGQSDILSIERKTALH